MTRGMFTELMETTTATGRAPRGQAVEARPTKETATQDRALSGTLEDLSRAGYTSHSYRFTNAELRWLRRFCLRASERLDRQVSHNTLLRLFFRLADQEWNTNPRENRLLDLLSRLRD